MKAATAELQSKEAAVNAMDEEFKKETDAIMWDSAEVVLAEDCPLLVRARTLAAVSKANAR